MGLYVWFIVASVIIRITQLRYLSTDMVIHLLRWFNNIKLNGGLRALGHAVGDYNVLYETIIALLTYIPVSAVLSIKLVSICFDYLLCYAVGYLVFVVTEDKVKATLAASVCAIHPVIYFNSAAWGQCDSIYTFWIILSIVYLLKAKYRYSFMCLGLAFSFKLQTIFILPFFLLYYIYKRNFSCLYFLFIPAVMFLSSLVGIIYGRGIFDFIKIYFRQTKEYPCLLIDYPNFWAYFAEVMVFYKIKWIYLASIFAVVMTFIIGSLIFLNNKMNLDNIGLIKLSFITTYSLVFFLPCMHERYSYLVDVLAIVLAVIDKNTLAMFTVLAIVNINSTFAFLFQIINPCGLLAIFNTWCFVLYLRYFLKQLDFKENLIYLKKYWKNRLGGEV